MTASTSSMPQRPSVDLTLMGIASLWEKRATCNRNRVGAVIAKDGRTLGSGYNGAPAGLSHCNHNFISVNSAGCKLAIHAEANAIAYAARNGVCIEGATIYTTLSPCFSCSQIIIAAGLIRVVYGREYRDMDGLRLLFSAGLTVELIGQ